MKGIGRGGGGKGKKRGECERGSEEVVGFLIFWEKNEEKIRRTRKVRETKRGRGELN